MFRHRFATLAAALPIVAGAMSMNPAPLAAYAAGQSVGQATYLGTTAPAAASSGGGFVDTMKDATAARDVGTPSSVSSALVLPSPNGTALSTSAGGARSFAGLTHADQRLAGTGPYVNTQFSLEPPDQGLCVGNGFVLETINDAFTVYSKAGAQLIPTTALNQFFKRSPAIIRTPTVIRGDFLSDPKCYFDPVGGRWIQTILEVDGPGALNGTDRTHVMLAVSTTGNPTGAWNLFSIDTSNDGTHGTPAHAGCPCLPDQPLLGANRDGVYITTNEFQLIPGNFPFNGTQIYALSRRGLEAAHSGSNPSFVEINAGLISTGDSKLPFWGSIQPSTSPQPQSGTEWLMSASPEDMFQNNALVDNRIAAWSLSGTNTLDREDPSLQLSHKVLTSESYGSDVVGGFSATQKSGPTPLRDALGDTDALNKLNANDSRMNQVVLADGKLYGAVNTAVTGHGQPPRVGIAYFVVAVGAGENNQNGQARGDEGGVSAQIAKQGYVAVNGANVLFPSIGVNENGQGAMVFTLSGPGFFPSAAYVRFNEDGVHGPIHITALGVLPDDGFTGYAAFGGNGIARWGDYSAAVADRDGSIWMATEWIPGTPRTVNANWGTAISHLSSGGD